MRRADLCTLQPLFAMHLKNVIFCIVQTILIFKNFLDFQKSYVSSQLQILNLKIRILNICKHVDSAKDQTSKGFSSPSARVNNSDECFRVCVFHLLPKSPHYSADMFRPWISINSLRLDCPKSFNAPKVVPLWSEKQWIAIFKAPERWRMSREVFFHEVLTFIRGMSLCKVLFKDHIAVFCKRFSLVNW